MIISLFIRKAFIVEAKTCSGGRCDGLEYVLQAMRVSAKRRVTIPTELEFGGRGNFEHRNKNSRESDAGVRGGASKSLHCILLNRNPIEGGKCRSL